MKEIIRKAITGGGHTNLEEAIEAVASRLHEAGYRRHDAVKGIAEAGQEMIAEECDRVKEMLLAKNRKYGNSAIEPLRVFSKATPDEQLNVRLDDKLSRLRSAQADEDEDVEKDLIGYLILKRVAKRILRGGA